MTPTRSPENPFAPPSTPPFRVVLVEPEIPPNTGNVGRLCAATGCPLHLIEPLGFEIDDSKLRRAGLDYWDEVAWYRHVNWDAYVSSKADASVPPPRTWFFSTHAGPLYWDISFEPGDALVFGPETRGLSRSFRQEREERVARIPIRGEAVRSLNLANSVAIVLYEAIRQCRPASLLSDQSVAEVDKGHAE